MAPSSSSSSSRHALVDALLGVYNWSLWSLLSLLLFSQVLGVFWESTSSYQHQVFGLAPQRGLWTVAGANDDPFSDRVLVCALQGRVYRPLQLREALRRPSTTKRPANNSVHGYRVLSRDELPPLPRETFDFYSQTCAALSTTIDAVVSACRALGYDLDDANDGLEIVDGLDSDDLATLVDVLPVLVMPYWDNALAARYVVPGRDGSACTFRGSGLFANRRATTANLRGISRSLREAKTVEWLQLPGGSWRHGWYEHRSSGSRWYADMISTRQDGPFGIPQRQFDLLQGAREADCRASATACDAMVQVDRWGESMFVEQRSQYTDSIVIYNGQRHGLFFFDALNLQVVVSLYGLDTLISNVSLGMLLFRWMAAMLALANAPSPRLSLGIARLSLPTQTIGIGSLACMRSFHLLPIVLLPRLKTTLAAFWTLGCAFEGEQRALSEAWFVVYPAIAESLLLLYSLLNLLAKLLRRRVSDALFGPTLLLLCLMHYCRFEIAHSGGFGVDGRVGKVLSSREFDALSLYDLVATRRAFELNGRVASLFYCKLAAIAANATLPFLLWSEPIGRHLRRLHGRAALGSLSSLEQALAYRMDLSAGLGRSPIYDMVSATETAPTPGSKTGPAAHAPTTRARTARNNATVAPSATRTSSTRVVVAYELARSGYLVLDTTRLVSINHWFWLLATAPLRRRVRVLNIRVVVFSISPSTPAKVESLQPEFVRVSDKPIAAMPLWPIAARPFQ
ncbi:hypothetical protein P43SY_001896 [Pythium insidiosum]|uniref:Transmembrane protein n=1 Tax=Pythium insidiosum TaxID=114742 RepID=A0AAD5L8J6_PYTIN|nr:hypothetical protein P43SY_001896 [Pythium insidiosum]